MNPLSSFGFQLSQTDVDGSPADVADGLGAAPLAVKYAREFFREVR